MHLTACSNFSAAGFPAIRFGAGQTYDIPLPVKTCNEHRAIVVIAAWLIGADQRWLASLWSYVAKPLVKTAVTKLRGTSEELDGIICIKGRETGLHGSKVLIAERQNIRAHGPSLASLEGIGAKQ